MSRMEVILTGRGISQQQQQQQQQQEWSVNRCHQHRHRHHHHRNQQSRRIKEKAMALRTPTWRMCCANAVQKEQIRRLCDWLREGGAEMQGLAILPVEGRGIGVVTQKRFGKGRQRRLNEWV